MQFRRSDLNDISYFLELAKHRNFRKAGLALGISASALSHALRGLEERLGVRLLNRTTRSVTLTAAGEALHAAVEDPFEKIGHAFDVVNQFRDAPMGRIKLSVPTEAASFLIGPVMATFLERYPDVEIEVSVSNRMIDVTESGFDAGIRYGGTVPEDMVAQRLSRDIRWVVVGAPSYLAQHGTPAHPNDLLNHRCIRIRIGDDSIYRWEFEHGKEQLAIDVPGGLIVDHGEVALTAVREGAGLLYAADPMVENDLETGELRSVLADWSPLGPGFHIYYSSRRQIPVALRLFIELVREMKPLGM
jgi:DNA-binding transcriptional LysR family regulator